MRFKSLDAHPVDDAIVVIFSRDDPNFGMDEDSDCQKTIRIRRLNEAVDLNVLAFEIIRLSNGLIPESHADDVISILNYMKRRQDVVSRTGARIDQLRPKTAGSERLDQYLKSKKESEKRQQRLRSSDFMFESIISPDFWTDFKIQEKEIPSIDDLNDLVEMLYEDEEKKIKGASGVFRLSQKQENLSLMTESETLILALIRVMREDGKRMTQVATLVTAFFAHLSHYSDFHPLILKYKFCSQSLDLVQHEVQKEESLFQDLHQNHDSDRTQASPENEHSLKKYQTMVRKQNHLLKASFCLMLSLSSDQKVEQKMLNRGLVTLLVKSLEREASPEFFTIVQIFLTKLSIRLENKNRFSETTVVQKLYVILSSAISSNSTPDLIHWNLCLLLNLSFDPKLRSQMIQIGILPKLLYVWSRDRLSSQPKTEKLMFLLLYQMSRGAKVRGLFNFSFGLGLESLDMMMGKMVKAIEQHVSGRRHENIMQMMGLMINLSLCPKNSLKISQTSVHISKLMDVVFDLRKSAQDADLVSVLILKFLRNVSFFSVDQENPAIKCFVQHLDRMCELTFDSSLLVKGLEEKLVDGRQDDLTETFVTESLGLMSSLRVDWESCFQDHGIWQWMQRRLDSACCEDDLLLDIILLLGSAVSQESCARLLVSSPSFVSTLVNLMHVKEHDDELVLQILFILCLLLHHESTRTCVSSDARVTDLLVDLMRDSNPRIRSQCSQALTVISEENKELGKKICMQRFRSHNNKWISFTHRQTTHDLDQEEDLSLPEFGGFDEEEEEDDDDEGDENLFLKPDLDSSLDSGSDSNPSITWDVNEMFDGSRSRASSRPVTAYKRRTRVSS